MCFEVDGINSDFFGNFFAKLSYSVVIIFLYSKRPFKLEIKAMAELYIFYIMYFSCTAIFIGLVLFSDNYVNYFM